MLFSLLFHCEKLLSSMKTKIIFFDVRIPVMFESFIDS